MSPYNADAAVDLISIPARYRNKKFGDLLATNPESVKAISTVRLYVDNFETALERGASGFFAGGVGTGKTLLACMIVERVLKIGKRAKYTTAWGLIQDIRAAYRDKSLSIQSQVSKYTSLDLLVVDEIGVQNGTDDERVLLYQVIDGRYNNVKPTIIISNSKNPVADGFIDLRTIDRLKEGGGFSITFNGESYRK